MKLFFTVIFLVFISGFCCADTIKKGVLNIDMENNVVMVGNEVVAWNIFSGFNITKFDYIEIKTSKSIFRIYPCGKIEKKVWKEIHENDDNIGDYLEARILRNLEIMSSRSAATMGSED